MSRYKRGVIVLAVLVVVAGLYSLLRFGAAEWISWISSDNRINIGHSASENWEVDVYCPEGMMTPFVTVVCAREKGILWHRAKHVVSTPDCYDSASVTFITPDSVRIAMIHENHTQVLFGLNLHDAAEIVGPEDAIKYRLSPLIGRPSSQEQGDFAVYWSASSFAIDYFTSDESMILGIFSFRTDNFVAYRCIVGQRWSDSITFKYLDSNFSLLVNEQVVPYLNAIGTDSLWIRFGRYGLIRSATDIRQLFTDNLDTNADQRIQTYKFDREEIVK